MQPKSISNFISEIMLAVTLALLLGALLVSGYESIAQKDNYLLTGTVVNKISNDARLDGKITPPGFQYTCKQTEYLKLTCDYTYFPGNELVDERPATYTLHLDAEQCRFYMRVDQDTYDKHAIGDTFRLPASRPHPCDLLEIAPTPVSP